MILTSKPVSEFVLRVRRFNRVVPIRAILQEAGIISGYENSIFCPFHPDELAGHKSGAIRDDGNVLFCFSERRAYRPYDVVKLVGKKMEDFAHLTKGGEDLTVTPQLVVPNHVPEDLYALVMGGKLTVYDVAERLREKYGRGI